MEHPLVELELVFDASDEATLAPFSGGFELTAMLNQQLRQIRSWSFDRLHISTSEENVVWSIILHSPVAGSVELPTAAERASSVSARIAWPGDTVAVVDDSAETRRCAVRWPGRSVVRWVRLGGLAVWVGLDGEGWLAGLTVESAQVTPARIPVRMDGGACALLLRDATFGGEWASFDSEFSGGREEVESVNGLISLSMRSGALNELVARRVEPADRMLELDASTLGEVEAWVWSPFDGSATRDDRGRISVKFGDTARIVQWSRVGKAITAGLAADGELLELRFGDVPVATTSRIGDLEQDVFEAIDHEADDDLADAQSTAFTVYGLEATAGSFGGKGSGRAGISSITLDFEAEAVTVQSALRGAAAGGWFEARDLLDADELEPAPIEIDVDAQPLPFSFAERAGRWVVVGDIESTSIVVSGTSPRPERLRLVAIDDFQPYADHDRRMALRRLEEHTSPETLATLRAQAAERRANPQRVQRRRDVRAASDALFSRYSVSGISEHAGELFTADVVEPWGGAERYGLLLHLHCMLRPIRGSGTDGSWPRLDDDRTARIRLRLGHAPLVASDGSYSMVMYAGQDEDAPEDVPDRAAIDRGERHEITLRLVERRDGWLIDTDMLAILIERIGPIEQIVRPFSQQLAE